MIKKVNFLNIPVDSLTMNQTVDIINNSIINKKQIHHTVVNAGKIVLMQNDKELEKSVLEADLINADGQAVVWAARLFGLKIPERVAGIDLMDNLIKLSHKKNYTCYFFGATHEVLQKVINHYSNLYSNEIVAGFHSGYFDSSKEKEIVNSIVNSKAKILFVAMPSPKKEIFLNKYKKELKKISLIMGVGGSFDVISGKNLRAPKIFQNLGMEWFFRFLQEPERMWKRYLFGNIQFIFLVIQNLFNIKK